VLERLEPLNALGWAYLVERADLALTLEVRLGDQLIARGTADRMREDLARAGVGNGNHAFELSFTRRLSPEELTQAQILVVSPFGQSIRLTSNLYAQQETEIDARPGRPPVAVRLTNFPLPAQDLEQEPVFVLGAARSGTSAIAQALLKCDVYQGFEEGHLLWIIQKFLETVHSFYEFNGEDGASHRFTMLSHTPYTYLTDAARATLVAAMSEMFSTRKWVDKTPRPEMIAAARLMQELWPKAKFIFMKRRGIENVASRLLKFPQLSFEDHCVDWANCMASWLNVRDLLGSSAIEVEQLALARRPELVASGLGRFLVLSEDAVSSIGRSLSQDLPEKTSISPAATLDIAHVPWSTSQVVFFRKTCGAMMAAFGYDYGGAYFASRVPEISIEI